MLIKQKKHRSYKKEKLQKQLHRNCECLLINDGERSVLQIID